MYNLSMYVDNSIAPCFEEKLEICDMLGFNNMELPECLDNKCISELKGAHLVHYRNLLIDRNKKIVLINTSRSVSDFGYFKKLFRNTHALGVENISVKMSTPEQAEAVEEICKMGKAYGTGVLLENEYNSCLSDNNAFESIYSIIRNEYSGLIFNPLEYVKGKSHPFFHVFYNSRLKNEIRFLRINDGLFSDGSAVLPGEGNAEIKELASILLSRSFKGYFSFIPYFVNNEIADYRSIIIAFKKLLKEM